MRYLVVFLLLGVVAMPVSATPTVIRSGEHEGYSRLVAALPDGVEWSVRQVGREVVLRYDRFDAGFETERVFRRIPRTRISTVTSDTNSLTLVLNCDCRVSAFTEKGAFVVIDVASPDVTLPTPLIAVEAAPVETASRAPDPNPDFVRFAAPALVPGRMSLNLTRQPLSSVEKRVLSDVQTHLAEEFGAASSRGVLTARIMPDRVEGAPDQVQQKPDGLTQEIFTPEPPIMSPLSNLRISSSRDIAPLVTQGERPVSADGVLCPRPGTFDVAAWGDNRPFSSQLAAARHGLFTELDRLNSDVALGLVKRYLYFGFGAEAAQVLRLSDTLLELHNHLLGLAGLYDDRINAAASQLASYVSCDTDVALWAILSLPDGASPLLPATDAALRSLNSLPGHLRSVLAPKLSQKLQDLGASDAAIAALRSLERLPQELPPAAEIAQAESAILTGNAPAGVAILEDVVAENSLESPEALVALVDARLKADQPIDHDVAGLVAAYAKELRNTPQGAELRRAHVIALLKSGQFDQAFDASSKLGGDDATQASSALRRTMLQELTDRASDIDFLHHAFSQKMEDIDQLDHETKVSMADRFLALGFPLRAENVLAHLQPEDTNDRAQVLAARAALALNKPSKASADLLGVENDEADRLRVRAQQLADARDTALQPLSERGGPAAPDIIISRAEGLQQIPPPGPLAVGNVPAQGALLQSITQKASDGMLARSAELLAQSTRARERIEVMLAGGTQHSSVGN
ncbi:hypothetical protein [Sulfitobacter aestuariivivens]|nr:hypothetical protein [Sulfitobacter aestuariivivens]